MGADLTLRFDPARVSVVDAYPELAGTQVAPGDAWLRGDTGFVALNQVDAARGSVRFAATLFNRPATGDVVLFTVVLRPKLGARMDGAYALSGVRLMAMDGDAVKEVRARWEGLDVLPAPGNRIHLPLVIRQRNR